MIMLNFCNFVEIEKSVANDSFANKINLACNNTENTGIIHVFVNYSIGTDYRFGVNRM